MLSSAVTVAKGVQIMVYTMLYTMERKVALESVIYHPEAATVRRVQWLNIQATIQAVEALYCYQCYVTVISGIVFPTL